MNNYQTSVLERKNITVKEAKIGRLHKVLWANSGCFLWRCSRSSQAIKGFVWVLWSANRMSSPSGRQRVVGPRSKGPTGAALSASYSQCRKAAWKLVVNKHRHPGVRVHSQQGGPKVSSPSNVWTDWCRSKPDWESSPETLTGHFHYEVNAS